MTNLINFYRNKKKLRKLFNSDSPITVLIYKIFKSALTSREDENYNSLINVLKQLKFNRRLKILLLCSGTSLLAKYVLRELGDRVENVYCVDTSKIALKYAKLWNRKSIKPICADATQVPLSNNSIDVIILHACVRYLSLSEIAKSTEEIIRIARENGFLICFGRKWEIKNLSIFLPKHLEIKILKKKIRCFNATRLLNLFMSHEYINKNINQLIKKTGYSKKNIYFLLCRKSLKASRKTEKLKSMTTLL